MLIDLHARTAASTPGAASPRRILEVAKERHLDGVAFVESLYSNHAREILAASEALEIPAFIGVEIPTTAGSFLCYAPEVEPFMHREEWRQIMAGGLAPTYDALFRLFDGVGGAVIASQPYDRSHGTRLGDRVTVCEGLHGVELMSSGTRVADAALATEISVKLGLPGAAGSASKALKDIGRFATMFARPVATQADLCEALRDGNFWAVTFGEPVKRERQERRRDNDRDKDGDKDRRRGDGRGRGRGRGGERSDRGDRGDRGGRNRGRGRSKGRGRNAGNEKGEQS